MSRGEFYTPKLIGAGETVEVGGRVGGFLCTTPGALTITDGNGAVVVNALPVVAGFNRIAVILNYTSNKVTSDTAVGTLLL